MRTYLVEKITFLPFVSDHPKKSAYFQENYFKQNFWSTGYGDSWLAPKNAQKTRVSIWADDRYYDNGPNILPPLSFPMDRYIVVFRCNKSINCGFHFTRWKSSIRTVNLHRSSLDGTPSAALVSVAAAHPPCHVRLNLSFWNLFVLLIGFEYFYKVR